MDIEMLDINGLKVANIHNSSSIAFFGILVLAGSNYETSNVAGISHYAEHMFFKHTKKRDWNQINQEFAKLGVQNNAFTSNNEVLYHASCPKENLEKVIALMLDMFFNSTMPKDEIEKERNVIIEEKKMYDDDPKVAFSNAIGDNMFVWNIGHDTMGTYETIKNITREDMFRYLREKTNLDNFVFVCSGNIKSSDLRRYIKKNLPKQHPYLSSGKGLNNTGTDGLWSDIVNKPDKIKFIMERKNITQSIAYMMIPALSAEDPMYYTESILYEACGGGMYSLLFSRIREELGLCYSTGMFSIPLSYPNKRISNVYGYMSPNNVDKFIKESEKVLKDVMKNGISKDIFECAKTDYLATILRMIETSSGMATYIARKILIYKKASIEDSIKKIRAVKREDCNKIAKKLFNAQYNWAVMNPK